MFQVIEMEGIDSMTIWEIQQAVRARGMRAAGLTESRLKYQLQQWIDLHLHHKIPPSLLILSRTLYLPDDLEPIQKLEATIKNLPDNLVS